MASKSKSKTFFGLVVPASTLEKIVDDVLRAHSLLVHAANRRGRMAARRVYLRKLNLLRTHYPALVIPLDVAEPRIISNPPGCLPPDAGSTRRIFYGHSI